MTEEPWPPANEERGTWQDTLGEAAEQEILIVPLNPLMEVAVANATVDCPWAIVSEPTVRLSEKSEAFSGVSSSTAAETLEWCVESPA